MLLSDNQDKYLVKKSDKVDLRVLLELLFLMGLDISHNLSDLKATESLFWQQRKYTREIRLA